ncbi:hypothetical protein SDC9_131200 [bioreactor metagenome]|uniref:Uncharacterized protein n=1 Tax=bioreactor metagenome TaxID=1076179 RepID=A0A645D4J3_9ZZZZ
MGDVSQGRGWCNSAFQVNLTVEEDPVGAEGEKMFFQRMQGDNYRKEQLQGIPVCRKLDGRPRNKREEGLKPQPKVFCLRLGKPQGTEFGDAFPNVDGN